MDDLELGEEVCGVDLSIVAEDLGPDALDIRSLESMIVVVFFVEQHQ